MVSSATAKISCSSHHNIHLHALRWLIPFTFISSDEDSDTEHVNDDNSEADLDDVLPSIKQIIAAFDSTKHAPANKCLRVI